MFEGGFLGGACVQVATLQDPASARLGESLYTFVPRSVVGNLRDGVVMESERLRVRGIPFLSLQNRCRARCDLSIFNSSCCAQRCSITYRDVTSDTALHKAPRNRMRSRTRIREAQLQQQFFGSRAVSVTSVLVRQSRVSTQLCSKEVLLRAGGLAWSLHLSSEESVLRAGGLTCICRMLWWVGAPVGLLAAVGALWGPLAVGLGIAQALAAIFILEDVNYIEHYGLQRSLTRSGRCAPASVPSHHRDADCNRQADAVDGIYIPLRLTLLNHLSVLHWTAAIRPSAPSLNCTCFAHARPLSSPPDIQS